MTELNCAQQNYIEFTPLKEADCWVFCSFWNFHSYNCIVLPLQKAAFFCSPPARHLTARRRPQRSAGAESGSRVEHSAASWLLITARRWLSCCFTESLVDKGRNNELDFYSRGSSNLHWLNVDKLTLEGVNLILLRRRTNLSDHLP